MRYALTTIFVLLAYSSLCIDAHASSFKDYRIIERDISVSSEPLIIVGEGGDASHLFLRAAETFRKKNGGVISSVRDGDEMIAAMRRFVRGHGRISQFVYYGHGNEVGLYVNQEPGVNGALYANDPAVNVLYRSASFYALRPVIFAGSADAFFFGCNVAKGYPDLDSFAERFANHFRVTVYAMQGPTEFSRTQGVHDPFPQASLIPSAFRGPVYMVATYNDQGVEMIEPAGIGIGGYRDVFADAEGSEAITALRKRGFELPEEGTAFRPYRNITYADAQAFCLFAAPQKDQCALPGYGYEPTDRIRNLHALKMLTEAFGFHINHPPSSHLAYVRWALDHGGLLTRDFMLRTWYSRAEMAQLTWNFIERFGQMDGGRGE